MPVDLDELDAIHARTTPGVWATTEDPIGGKGHHTMVCLPRASGLYNTWIAECHSNWRDAIRGEHRISWLEATRNATLITALHNAYPAMSAELREARAEIGRLREALEPFDDALGEDDEFSDETKVTAQWGRHTDYSLRLGDFRRARQALTKGD